MRFGKRLKKRMLKIDQIVLEVIDQTNFVFLL